MLLFFVQNKSQYVLTTKKKNLEAHYNFYNKCALNLIDFDLTSDISPARAKNFSMCEKINSTKEVTYP